jgi:hypothetical protein
MALGFKPGREGSFVAAFVVALLVALESPAVAAQGYTPLRAEPGSSGRFGDDLGTRLPLSYGPQQSEISPGRPPTVDAHAGVRGYAYRSCESCHAEHAENIHSARADITCRQCHGADPIASVDHYFAPMNPIRRHAYVCAKCHEGANASYATYVNHVPTAARAPEVRESFPALYWVDWFMTALIIGVFLIFLPHSVGWWLREWFVKRKSET